MLINLKLALRHLWRRKIYTVIILLSLIAGFTCSNLLISFLLTEVRTDSHHTHKDKIFQLFSNDPFGGKGKLAFITGEMKAYLNNYPEVEGVCQMSDVKGILLETEAGVFQDVLVLSTDSSFFSFFDFPVYQGNIHHGFSPSGIILTKERAKILFGDADVTGRTLTLKTNDISKVLTVAAVVDKPSENSHLNFEALVHHAVLNNTGTSGASYIMLNEALQHDHLEKKINTDVNRPGLIGPGKLHYSLEPLTASYFNTDNRMVYMKTRSRTFIWVGGIVCALILFMASFNFANLFLLSLQERKKETGIKKSLGISLSYLIRGSFAEVILYVFIGFNASLLITWLLLPVFNTTVEATLAFSYLSRIEVISALGLMVFLLGITVVLLSVLQQWRIKPVRLLRSATTTKVTFNRFLFTVQFVISITLVVCAITIIHQMNYIKHEPLGFNRNIIQLQAPDKDASSKLAVVKQKVLQISGVSHATLCSGNPISGNAIGRYELEDGNFYTPFLFSGDHDFIRTLDLTVVEGEPLKEGKHGKLVNEKLVRLFNITQPIGATIPGTEDKIIGVVKDFTCVSFKEEIPPVIISYESAAHRMLIDFNDQELSSLIPHIQNVWNQVFPGHPFSYQIIQQDLLKKHKEDTFLYKIITAFSFVSMIISCFGLFALSWAVIQSRIKEIGIRKVLGAMPRDVLKLLTGAFIKRIAIAFLIAMPMGYFVMNSWLENFAKKISLSGWIFVLAAGVVLVIALVTLSIQTVKAAYCNPVDELKNE